MVLLHRSTNDHDPISYAGEGPSQPAPKQASLDTSFHLHGRLRRISYKLSCKIDLDLRCSTRTFTYLPETSLPTPSSLPCRTSLIPRQQRHL